MQAVRDGRTFRSLEKVQNDQIASIGFGLIAYAASTEPNASER
jgi:hypothetical protein